MPTVLLVSYSRVFGGAERVLLDCASGTPGAPILACPNGELAERARSAGIGVLTLAPRSLDLRAGPLTGARAIGNLLGHARELRRLVRSVNPDLIVVWGMRSAIALQAGVRGMVGQRQAERFVFAHNDFLPGPVIGLAVRAAANRAAAVIVPSRAVAEDLDPRGRLGERLTVVNPGIDPDEFTDAGPATDPPEVLVLGSLAAWKRPDLAFEIFAEARRQRPELRLRLVGAPISDGDGTLAPLRARAARRDVGGAATLAGPSRDPRSDLKRATCLLHCSPREPFGLVLLEAMACARPVIAPAAAGPREIVAEDCGRLYPPENVTAAAAALVELTGLPDRGRALGLAGRRRVRERFDRRQTQDGFARALGGAMNGTARRQRPQAQADPNQLTVVTVTHNSEDDLPKLLRSIARYLPGCRVIVVDCASHDASVAQAELLSVDRVVALPQNVGFGRGCNRGLEHVTTPVTALLNPDVELLDGSILELAAQALRSDQPARLMAPSVLNPDGSRQQTVHPLPVTAADMVRSLVPPAAVPGRLGIALAPWRSDRPRLVGWAVGAALVARTETLRTLGPFDESIFMYCEDLELGWRAGRQGIQTWLWPSARVLHRGAHTSLKAFGGEAFDRLAIARHDVVKSQLGPRGAAFDDLLQGVAFGSRAGLKRALGGSGARERRQLSAVISLRRGKTR